VDRSHCPGNCCALAGDVDASGVRSITLLSMCGRYVRRSDKQKIAEHFSVHGPSLPDFGPSWNVAPQTFQPVIRLPRDTGQREVVLMRWGLIPFWDTVGEVRKSFGFNGIKDIIMRILAWKQSMSFAQPMFCIYDAPGRQLLYEPDHWS